MFERVDNVIEVVGKMDDDEKRELIRRIIDENLLPEDDEDALIIASRQNDPITPYSDFLDDLRKEGRPV
ncbi:hypothetical protein ISS30_05855 [bacterium]|nr:hypothetical protein [FCB group bacterium]MBL7191201.1 hypothetical protein [bacterium]